MNKIGQKLTQLHSKPIPRLCNRTKKPNPLISQPSKIPLATLKNFEKINQLSQEITKISKICNHFQKENKKSPGKKRVQKCRKSINQITQNIHVKDQDIIQKNEQKILKKLYDTSFTIQDIDFVESNRTNTKTKSNQINNQLDRSQLAERTSENNNQFQNRCVNVVNDFKNSAFINCFPNEISGKSEKQKLKKLSNKENGFSNDKNNKQQTKNSQKKNKQIQEKITKLENLLKLEHESTIQLQKKCKQLENHFQNVCQNQNEGINGLKNQIQILQTELKQMIRQYQSIDKQNEDLQKRNSDIIQTMEQSIVNQRREQITYIQVLKNTQNQIKQYNGLLASRILPQSQYTQLKKTPKYIYL